MPQATDFRMYFWGHVVYFTLHYLKGEMQLSAKKLSI